MKQNKQLETRWSTIRREQVEDCYNISELELKLSDIWVHNSY